MSIVEDTLRSQREVLREIVDRTGRLSNREVGPEAPKRILLFGVGSSHFAARLTAYALMRDKSRARIPVIACASGEIGPEIIPFRGDWAFAFSHRGKTPVTQKALRFCEQVGAHTILVAAQGAEPPEEASRYVLETSPLERCEPHTMGVTGAIAAVTTLLIGEKASDEWKALAAMPDPDLELCRHHAKEGPALLLGECEGEWLAREGALKLMEMARLPVRVFGSEEFFHGPRFSARPEDPIWHVSLPRDPRNDVIRAAYRIQVNGASPLAWVPALIELQWLALAVAMNRGIEPDSPSSLI